ncbi:hypothetical protein K7X08_034093 [Anisodus acutangulus]|uniref:Uncharacterized protein n=1 Tax=Anisodus acutangulus TaxID=402998 RepID=A0A9Q1R9M3_9SOLA|nr:hypothetical protein K7X08_034093 [Anisodus acutangulus]
MLGPRLTENSALWSKRQMTALLKGSCIHRDNLVGCNPNFKKLTCETYVLFGSEEVREKTNLSGNWKH